MGLRLDDDIRKTVVFIGIASSGPFVPIGTGFVALWFVGDQGFQYVVTCKHVIDMIPYDIVHIRVNRRDGEAEVIGTEKHYWTAHPDPRVDLMVCPTQLPIDQFDIRHFDLGAPTTLSHIAEDRAEIGIGDDVYVAGMFVARVGETRNIPILRTGTIAAMPEEKIETQYGYHDAYLIEARSIDGLSGSPVSAFTSILRLKDGKVIIPPINSFYLIGMLLGHNQVINPSEVIEIEQKGAKRGEPPEKIQIPLNTGIGVLLPITYAVEAIDQEKLRQKREAILQGRQKDRSFAAGAAIQPSGAPAGSEPPMDGSPEHKERFTRMLGAATEGSKSGDET
jgi:hypothetical protein